MAAARGFFGNGTSLVPSRLERCKSGLEISIVHPSRQIENLTGVTAAVIRAAQRGEKNDFERRMLEEVVRRGSCDSRYAGLLLCCVDFGSDFCAQTGGRSSKSKSEIATIQIHSGDSQAPPKTSPGPRLARKIGFRVPWGQARNIC